jgi:hypothetical protein
MSVWRRLSSNVRVLVTSLAMILGFSLQVHAQGDACAVTPSSCTPLPLTSAQQPFIVNQCYQIPPNAQPYVYNYVNVVAGGALVFVDDGGTIDFRVNSLLVEQGGCVKAGSWNAPFGSNGGKLKIAKGKNGASLLPLTLVALPGSTSGAAVFATLANSLPRVRIMVKVRDTAAGRLEFSLKVKGATIPPSRVGSPPGASFIKSMSARIVFMTAAPHRSSA